MSEHHSVEVDAETFRALQFAASMAGVSAGAIVARLIQGTVTAADTARSSPSSEARPEEMPEGVRVYANYGGHRIEAKFEPRTQAVVIDSPPWSGERFKSPTGAARSVVEHLNPRVDSNRNGWTFWVIDDANARLLSSIRPR